MIDHTLLAITFGDRTLRPIGRVVLSLLIALPLVVLSTACDRNDLPAQPPDITGEITQVTATASGLSLRIEEVPSELSGPVPAQAVVQTDASTRWSGLPAASGEVRTGAPPGVRVGVRAQVYFRSRVTGTYPVQAQAALITILPAR